MGAKQLQTWDYTYEDYKEWEGRWELIDGQPFDMSPMPIPEHQRISNNISVLLTIALKKAKCRHCKVYHPLDYLIGDNTVLNPDILIVCKPINKHFLDFRPALVVEILSPSTAMRDRVTKFQLYENQGIPYYLIVDIPNKSILIYRFQDNNYVLQQIGDNNLSLFTLDDGCSITVDWEEVWD